MAIPVPSQIPVPDPGYPVIKARRRVVLIGPGNEQPSPVVPPRLTRLLRGLRAKVHRASG